MSEPNQLTSEVEVIAPESSALRALESASIDIQIATAKKYPRKLAEVKAKMLSMATLDEETAEGCYYTLKRKDKNGDVKIIQGPSIRLAEIAANAFGNIRSGSRLIANDGKTVTCQGVSHDLEQNVYYSTEVTRRITTRTGATYSDDMVATTINAANAVALRNAIVKAVPLALIKPVYEAAKKVAVGDVRSLAVRRGKIIARLKQMGASQDSILAAVECSTVDEITTDKLEILIGLGTALKDGDTTLEDAFPAVGGKLHSKGATKAPEPVPEASAAQEPPVEPPAPVDAPEAPPVPSDPLPEQPTPAPEAPPQQRLMSLVLEAGYSFKELVVYLLNENHLMDPPKTPDDIPAALAARLLRNDKGLLMALKRGRVL